ncbi:hypothetical protein [Shouchella patagoniensis]|uniref:hypothetical protein n=1 Tax=Shouchella patagoniensis TaxID=228576 RepID=UPI00111661F6|nr:hypothetical protein [Shouchella patagoniensis]
MNKKLRVGIIGGSINNGWAKETHIPAIEQLDDLELKAVSTSNMKIAVKSADAFNAPYALIMLNNWRKNQMLI